MLITKQEAIDTIQHLPDSFDTEELYYRFYVLENIRKGQQDVAEGKTVSSEQLLQEIKSW